MTLSGGRPKGKHHTAKHRPKVNKSLIAWVAFVKKVQREEKLNYKEAIRRAKQRKDRGEKWMKGGADMPEDAEVDMRDAVDDEMAADKDLKNAEYDMDGEDMDGEDMNGDDMDGGRHRKGHGRRTRRRSRGRARGRTMRRGRGRSARRY